MACPYDSSQINVWLVAPFTTEWVREQGQPLGTGEHVMHTKAAFYTEFLFHQMFSPNSSQSSYLSWRRSPTT